MVLQLEPQKICPRQNVTDTCVIPICFILFEFRDAWNGPKYKPGIMSCASRRISYLFLSLNNLLPCRQTSMDMCHSLPFAIPIDDIGVVHWRRWGAIILWKAIGHPGGRIRGACGNGIHGNSRKFCGRLSKFGFATGSGNNIMRDGE